MKLRDLFGRAADALTAWREQQKAALTEKQRQRYEKLQGEQLQIEKRKIKEQDAAREKLVTEERRRLLLEKPAPALRMFTPRPVRQARLFYLARSNVKARQTRELQAVKQAGEKKLDQYLLRAEKEREAPLVREDFDEAAKDRVEEWERLQQRLVARAAERKRQKGDGDRER